MPKKILVVDDEADVVRYFTALLQEHGYETCTAADGAEALTRVHEDRPDLVTLDITMPGQSGVRVYREMKAHWALSRIPVVVVTGVSSDFKQFISTRSQVPPPDGYLEKPVRPDDLLNEVRRLIG